MGYSRGLGSLPHIALDATTSIGESLSGVGVYSRELLYGLAASDSGCEWEWFFRSQRYWRSLRNPIPAGVTRRFLADSWGSRSATLFHGLNQRLPRRRFRQQIATFHDLFVLSGEYSTAEFRDRFAQQAREAANGADLIIAVSAFTAGQVEALLGVDRGRIRVIHHGVVPRMVPAARREKIVLCVGALQRRKNQASLVRAFRAMPAGWRLVLAGSAGFGAEETMREVEASPRAADILVTGYVSDAHVAEWYGKASLFAFPSLDEGFGMPVLEAMAAGVPVVAGSGSALSEVCGDAALLVDAKPAGAKNHEALGSALLALAENAELRNQLITRGYERAARFSWDRAVRSTLDVYRELSTI